MGESRTVTVGLDVHASSIRLAAVRADELLEERTLPYDHDALERALRRWPQVRCCYEAGEGCQNSESRFEPRFGCGAVGRIDSVPCRVAGSYPWGLRPSPGDGHVVGTVNLSVFRRHPCGESALSSACKSAGSRGLNRVLAPRRVRQFARVRGFARFQGDCVCETLCAELLVPALPPRQDPDRRRRSRSAHRDQQCRGG
jgi:hypothetical protein